MILSYRDDVCSLDASGNRANLLDGNGVFSRSYCVAAKAIRGCLRRERKSGSKKNTLNSFPINRFLRLDYRRLGCTGVIQIARGARIFYELN